MSILLCVTVYEIYCLFYFIGNEQLLQYLNLCRVLQSLLADEQLRHCPVLILGNKIDMPGAASEDYIRQFFGLYGQTTGKVKTLQQIVKFEQAAKFIQCTTNKFSTFDRKVCYTFILYQNTYCKVHFIEKYVLYFIDLEYSSMEYWFHIINTHLSTTLVQQIGNKNGHYTCLVNL